MFVPHDQLHSHNWHNYNESLLSLTSLPMLVDGDLVGRYNDDERFPIHTEFVVRVFDAPHQEYVCNHGARDYHFTLVF